MAFKLVTLSSSRLKIRRKSETRKILPWSHQFFNIGNFLKGYSRTFLRMNQISWLLIAELFCYQEKTCFQRRGSLGWILPNFSAGWRRFYSLFVSFPKLSKCESLKQLTG